MNKEEIENLDEDYFYYAKLFGVPCYFNPLDNEVIGRNKLCDFLIDNIILPITDLFGVEYKFKIYKRTTTRKEIQGE